MIIWGSRGKSLNLGKVKTEQCSICEKERDFNLVLNYRYFGFYWIFNIVTKKVYMLVCNICNRGWELDKDKVEKEILSNVPIPFMHKYGLFVFLGIIAIITLLVSISK
jgi:uncharacterized protein YlaI